MPYLITRQRNGCVLDTGRARRPIVAKITVLDMCGAMVRGLGLAKTPQGAAVMQSADDFCNKLFDTLQPDGPAVEFAAGNGSRVDARVSIVWSD